MKYSLQVDYSCQPKPDYTRVLKAIQRQGNPNSVPFLELFADPEVIAATLNAPTMPWGGQSVDRGIQAEYVDQAISFWYQLGYDAFWLAAVLPEPNTNRLAAEDTADLARNQREWFDESAAAVTSWADFERITWPKVEDADLYILEYALKNIPEGMGLIVAVRGVLEFVMEFMGYETFALALYDQPDLVEAMFSKQAEIYLPLARTVAQMDGVIGLWMGDDMGFRTGTMVGPEHLRKYTFPLQKQYAAIAHEQGLPFLLHSCGQLKEVMDDLIDDVGIDAKHSYEDLITPVEKIVATYGDRVSVVGGIDVDLLVRGTEEQIRARTREVLEACAPGGGYMLGSGNSIANYIPINNFLTMLDEGRQFNEAAETSAIFA